jgi:hypothetical protein
MKFMYYFNVDTLQANTEVIGMNPNMQPLYEAMLLFKTIPASQTSSYRSEHRPVSKVRLRSKINAKHLVATHKNTRS